LLECAQGNLRSDKITIAVILYNIVIYGEYCTVSGSILDKGKYFMENISVICGNRYAREYRSPSAEIFNFTICSLCAQPNNKILYL